MIHERREGRAREPYSPPAQVGTLDTRLLLMLLERALPVAERIDAARGRVMPHDARIPSVMSKGTDLAAQVNDLVLRLRSEGDGLTGKH